MANLKTFEKMSVEQQFMFLVNETYKRLAKLYGAMNNLQYIKALQSVIFWLNRLENFCHLNKRFYNTKEWHRFFSNRAPWFPPLYDSLLMDKKDYNIGIKPFKNSKNKPL